MDTNMYSPTPSSPSLSSTTSTDLPPLLSHYWPDLDSPNRNLNPSPYHPRDNTRMNTTTNIAQCSSSTPDTVPTSPEDMYDETAYECGIFMDEAYGDGAVDNVNVDVGIDVEMEMDVDMDVQLYFDMDGYISQTAHPDIYNSTSSPHAYSSSPDIQSTQTPASTPIPFAAPGPHRLHSHPAPISSRNSRNPNPTPTDSTISSPASDILALNPAHNRIAHERDLNLDPAASSLR